MKCKSPNFDRPYIPGREDKGDGDFEPKSAGKGTGEEFSLLEALAYIFLCQKRDRRVAYRIHLDDTDRVVDIGKGWSKQFREWHYFVDDKFICEDGCERRCAPLLAYTEKEFLPRLIETGIPRTQQRFTITRVDTSPEGEKGGVKNGG